MSLNESLELMKLYPTITLTPRDISTTIGDVTLEEAILFITLFKNEIMEMTLASYLESIIEVYNDKFETFQIYLNERKENKKWLTEINMLHLFS